MNSSTTMAETFVLLRKNFDVIFTTFCFILGFYFLKKGRSSEVMKEEGNLQHSVEEEESKFVEIQPKMNQNSEKKSTIVKEPSRKKMKKEEKNIKKFTAVVKKMKIQETEDELSKNEGKGDASPSFMKTNDEFNNTISKKGEVNPSHESDVKVVFSNISPVISHIFTEKKIEEETSPNKIEEVVNVKNENISNMNKKEVPKIDEAHVVQNNVNNVNNNENNKNINTSVKEEKKISNFEKISELEKEKKIAKEEEDEKIMEEEEMGREEEESKKETTAAVKKNIILSKEIKKLKQKEVEEEEEEEDDSSIPCINLSEELKDEENLSDDVYYPPILKNETPPSTPPKIDEDNVFNVTKGQSSLFRTFSNFTTKLFSREENETVKNTTIESDEQIKSGVHEKKEDWVVLDKDIIEKDIVEWCLSSSLSMKKQNL